MNLLVNFARLWMPLIASLLVVTAPAPMRLFAQSSQPGSRKSGPIEVWARPGRTLALPFKPTAAQIQEGVVPARLSGGTRVYAPLWWIGPAAQADPPSSPAITPGEALVAGRAAAWMSVATNWRALSAVQVRGSLLPDSGEWYLLIDLPPDFKNQDLILDGRTLSTGWLQAAPFNRPEQGSLRATGWAKACIDALRDSPTQRWRARLASGEPLVALGPARDEFSQVALESVAEQIEAEWSEGLDRLSAADPAAALELRRMLTSFVDFERATVPVWPFEETSLETLRNDLLSPSLNAGARTRKVRDWLLAQPRQAVWVADDAAVLDQRSGVPGVRVAGVLLTADSGALAMMISRQGSAKPDEIVTLNPGAVGTALLGSIATATSESLKIDLGNWRCERKVVPRAVQSAPPGIMFSPFFEDWSLPAWMAAATDVGDRRTGVSLAGIGVPVVDANSTTVAMLLSQNAAGIGESQPSWTLYLECASANPSAPTEEVLISLSGSGGQTTLRAFSDGRVASAQGESKTVPSEHEAAVWKAWVPLPAAIIVDGNWIRLGLCRIDAAGARSAWPRPMFPWEDLPPHAAIDLRPWSGMPQITP